MFTAAESSSLIKQKALELGFSACGISKAEELTSEITHLQKWLDAGMQAGMSYMENHFQKRTNPVLLVEGAKSVISVLLNYFPAGQQVDESAPVLSKYAYGKDYHFVVKEKLAMLMDFMQEQFGEVSGRAFVDSAPVLDKVWAVRSGLGWIGKNSCLITKKGSFFFIGELIVDIELSYDSPLPSACGKCRACMDACPTQAIVEPGVVDARKCISYWTIEHKGDLPDELKGKFRNRVVGCDICQDVCPWNSKSEAHNETGFTLSEDLKNMTAKQWHEMLQADFSRLFKDSAVKRCKYKGIRRNLDFLAE